MLLPHFLASIASLLALVNGSATPSSDVVVIPRKSTSVRGLTTDLVGPPLWTTKNIAPSPLGIDAGAPNTQVVLAVITSNTALAGGLCVIGVIPACIVGAAVVAITNFYLVYATLGVTDSPRVVLNAVQPKANATDGVWTSIGNTTVNGIFHEVHFRQLGPMLGVKAIQSTAGAKDRRDDTDDDGGYVAAYFWEDNNQQAWNDWNSAQVQPAGEEIGNYIVNTNGQIICADIIDQDGPMNAGVMTMDDNNDEYGLTQSQWASALSICLSGDPSVP